MAPRTKHQILVHGRSTEPSETERLARPALVLGAARTGEPSGQRLRTGEVRVPVAYHGDVDNRILPRSDHDEWRWRTRRDLDHGDAPREDGAYDEFVRRRHVKRIHACWRGGGGHGSHELHGYLDHPKVGAEIAGWVRS